MCRVRTRSAGHQAGCNSQQSDMPYPSSPSPGADPEPHSAQGPPSQLNPISHTSRITAGFRAVEQRHPKPIIQDPLAIHLAGPEGLATAEADWQRLNQLQGPGKHLRVPARNRILDDEIVKAVAGLADRVKPGSIQVVNLGCGMVSEQQPLLTHRHHATLSHVLQQSTYCAVWDSLQL